MDFDSNLTVMVVDDNQSLRRTIGDILRAVGLSSQVQAEDGLAAWKKLQDTQVDLIILDWDMPNMNGMELLEKIRQANDRFGQIKVLMLTAHATRNDVMEAIHKGAQDYVVKPFSPDTLYAKLNKLLKSRDDLQATLVGEP